jgi:hypothetical protein
MLKGVENVRLVFTGEAVEWSISGCVSMQFSAEKGGLTRVLAEFIYDPSSVKLEPLPAKGLLVPDDGVRKIEL